MRKNVDMLPKMKLAFQSISHLASWVVVLFFVLFAPVVNSFFVPVDVRYQTMSRRTGPSDWLSKIALSDSSSLDILFVGHSQTLTNIDHSVLQHEIARRGVSATSATVAMTWANFDFAYLYLSELFRHRSVKLVVLPLGPRQESSHSATKYLRRLQTADPGLSLANLRMAATNYAEMSLISLRLLSALAFPPGRQVLQGYRWWREVGENEEQTHGTWLAERGFQSRDGMEKKNFHVVGIREGVDGYTLVSHNDPTFQDLRFGEESLSDFEMAYVPAIRELCEKHGANLVLLRQPLMRSDEIDSVSIPRRARDLGVPILYATLRSTFGTGDAGIMKDYFYNESHLNANGAKQNAYAIAKAIMPFLATTISKAHD